MQKWPRPVVWASWVVILWGVCQAKTFLVPLLLAALLSFLMTPLIKALERQKVPEWASILISSVLLFLPVLTVGALLLSEGSILIRDFPRIEASIKEWIGTIAQSSFV